MAIPYTYHGLVDLLQGIADPNRDPNMDIADGVTLMDYWRRDAQRLLPTLTRDMEVDEALLKLLDTATWKAVELRNLREEVRGRSSNFPTLEPLQYAQQAASMINALVAAIRSRSAAPAPAANGEALEALRWYADADNWKSRMHPTGYGNVVSVAVEDNGNRARAALTASSAPASPVVEGKS